MFLALGECVRSAADQVPCSAGPVEGLENKVVKVIAEISHLNGDTLQRPIEVQEKRSGIGGPIVPVEGAESLHAKLVDEEWAGPNIHREHDAVLMRDSHVKTIFTAMLF